MKGRSIGSSLREEKDTWDTRLGVQCTAGFSRYTLETEVTTRKFDHKSGERKWSCVQSIKSRAISFLKLFEDGNIVIQVNSSQQYQLLSELTVKMLENEQGCRQGVSQVNCISHRQGKLSYCTIKMEHNV